MKVTLEQQLLESGVKNLKEFGYPTVTIENILTDDVFKLFFKSMLEETKENCHNNKIVLDTCDFLLIKIGA